LVLYTDTLLDRPDDAKTAYGILRFSGGDVTAVWDKRHAGRRVCDVAPGLGNCVVPVVGEPPRSGLPYEVVVGFNPFGRRLTEEQRADLRQAVAAGARIVNGTHDVLPWGESVVNLRDPLVGPFTVAEGSPAGRVRIVTVGSSHAIGKLTATVLLAEALVAAGISATWVPTGQTGVVIAERGRVIDSIPIDFVPGAVEALLAEHAAHGDVVIVEGQGSIFHPSYSPSTVALVHASAPHYLLLCHRLGQDILWGFETPMPSAPEAASAYLRLAESLGLLTDLLGVSLDSSRVGVAEYRSSVAELESVLGVPVVDPVRDSPEPLVERLRELLPHSGQVTVSAP
jgi:uncharacterized NAD-dependent epimerase/dehydratase family protein